MPDSKTLKRGRIVLLAFAILIAIGYFMGSSKPSACDCYIIEKRTNDEGQAVQALNLSEPDANFVEAVKRVNSGDDAPEYTLPNPEEAKRKCRLAYWKDEEKWEKTRSGDYSGDFEAFFKTLCK